MFRTPNSHRRCTRTGCRTGGGSITELASYVLLPIIKILGMGMKTYISTHIYTMMLTSLPKGIVLYKHTTALFQYRSGCQNRGDLVISGTKGYAYVPAPWWNTRIFRTLRFEFEQTENTFINLTAMEAEVWDQRLSDRMNNPQWKQYKFMNSNR